MTDMHYGLSNEEPTLEEIKNMYLQKTARYSFSLPFVLGASFSQAPQNDTKKLLQLGEYVGLCFQLKDDQLKLIGSEKEVGTDIGSDVRENKKTLIRYWLFHNSNSSEKQNLSMIFGKKSFKKKMYYT